MRYACAQNRVGITSLSSTSNLMREIHSMHETNSVEAKMNNEEKENLGNQSIDLEHTSCCGKFCFIYVTSRCNAEQK